MIRRQWVNALVLVAITAFGAGCVRESVGNSPIAQPPGRSGQALEKTAPAPSAADRPEVIAAKPSWFACRKDADCVVAKGPCGQYQAVNLNFLTDFAVFSQRMGQMIACESAKTKKQEATPSVQCLKSRCSLSP
ncbi:hypothetical protein [Vampirovibrio chlorellavorus]|uniref:hypothetical protein n=1 Tax=Vampirovibrio chlorellavorus TaxID=758823 RepID=UPI0026EBC42D|nr:hypothetical protein [Vampirovibrio chlorellavorus]